MSDAEIFENSDEPELEVVKKKNTKKPMSEERKAQLREQLRKAREAKKKKKEAGIEEPKDPNKSKVKKMLEAEGEEPAVYVKAVKRVGKDHTEDIKALKEEIASLKSSKTSKEDMEEIRTLKAELKELRDIAKQYKKQQLEKKKVEQVVKQNTPKENIKTKIEEKPVERLIPPTPVKPRYSTYKKSVWSQFT